MAATQPNTGKIRKLKVSLVVCDLNANLTNRGWGSRQARGYLVPKGNSGGTRHAAVVCWVKINSLSDAGKPMVTLRGFTVRRHLCPMAPPCLGLDPFGGIVDVR